LNNAKIKKTRRSEQQWRAIIAEHTQSGGSVQRFCQRRGIGCSTFHQWKSRLSMKASTVNKHSDFVEVLAPTHQRYYYPQMTREEVILIKQWDSAGPMARSNGLDADSSDQQAPCTFSFHSAFKDPSTQPDAPERWSIETRCIVMYD
jgi:transposase-like protein